MQRAWGAPQPLPVVLGRPGVNGSQKPLQRRSIRSCLFVSTYPPYRIMTGAALESLGAEASNSTRADIGGQCREVFEGRREVDDLPVRGRVFLEAGSPMRRRITRGHVDGGQWDSKPSTHSLDDRFLSNPGGEEVSELILAASVGDEIGFGCREKPLG